MMTPYLAEYAHKTATQYVEAGYAFVAVDVRGRGNSEGSFTPLRGNGPDGADCLTHNCAARRACPVGAEFRYSDAQSQFHMRNFRKSVQRHVQSGMSETDTRWAPAAKGK